MKGQDITKYNYNNNKKKNLNITPQRRLTGSIKTLLIPKVL